MNKKKYATSFLQTGFAIMIITITGCQTTPSEPVQPVKPVPVIEKVPEPPKIVCLWEKIPSGVVLKDYDSDNRYELKRTADGLIYRLTGTNEIKNPECSWRLRHLSCSENGCLFQHVNKKTTYLLSGNDEIVVLKRKEKRVFGNDPKSFRLK